jgi:hypothetical protein
VVIGISNQNADDIRLKQAPDFCLPLLQFAIKTRVFERNRRLYCYQFENCDMSSRECVRRQRIFKEDDPG